jgi:hypothetical protein
VAANATLDAMAHYLCEHGQPAVAINWGPWAEVGMAANVTQRKWETLGLGMITPSAGLEALEQVLGLNKPQYVICVFNVKTLAKKMHDGHAGLLAKLLEGNHNPEDQKRRVGGGGSKKESFFLKASKSSVGLEERSHLIRNVAISLF